LASLRKSAEESREEAPSQEELAQAARRQVALAGLLSQGVGAVLRDEQGAAALLGSRRVRVGDELEGFRVVAIEQDGVVLEAVTASDRGGREGEPRHSD
jgi:hypothetical protein